MDRFRNTVRAFLMGEDRPVFALEQADLLREAGRRFQLFDVEDDDRRDAGAFSRTAFLSLLAMVQAAVDLWLYGSGGTRYLTAKGGVALVGIAGSVATGMAIAAQYRAVRDWLLLLMPFAYPPILIIASAMWQLSQRELAFILFGTVVLAALSGVQTHFSRAWAQMSLAARYTGWSNRIPETRWPSEAAFWWATAYIVLIAFAWGFFARAEGESLAKGPAPLPALVVPYTYFIAGLISVSVVGAFIAWILVGRRLRRGEPGGE